MVFIICLSASDVFNYGFFLRPAGVPYAKE
jgi:hypothetical protein